MQDKCTLGLPPVPDTYMRAVAPSYLRVARVAILEPNGRLGFAKSAKD